MVYVYGKPILSFGQPWLSARDVGYTTRKYSSCNNARSCAFLFSILLLIWVTSRHVRSVGLKKGRRRRRRSGRLRKGNISSNVSLLRKTIRPHEKREDGVHKWVGVQENKSMIRRPDRRRGKGRSGQNYKSPRYVYSLYQNCTRH